jgi:hypothetical protein
VKILDRRHRIAATVLTISAAAALVVALPTPHGDVRAQELPKSQTAQYLPSISDMMIQAAGSFQTKPALPDMARSEDSDAPAASTWPNLSPSYLVGGCGKGRVSEPQIHTCRGPADIR